MNRANQKALFQATNQGLLGIRQQEINYYINLNIAFGTQAALVGGFTYGTFTQILRNDENGYADVFQDVCWIASSATIAVSVHVILTTMVLQVMGPGLALHGPVGSIVRATEGMKLEQRAIVTSFIVMMVLFAISTTLSFWVVMDFESAIGSSAVFLIAARYWYAYCERIYLRFHWEDENTGWRESSEDDPDPLQEAGAQSKIPQQARSQSGASGSGPSQRLQRNSGSSQGSRQSNRNGPFFPKFFSRLRRKKSSSKKAKPEEPERQDSVSRYMSADKRPAANPAKAPAMEGYLGKRTVSPKDVGKHEPWERRYVVLSASGEIYTYKNRQDFRIDPKEAAINKRPLDIFDYFVVFENTEEALRMGSVADNESDAGSTTSMLRRHTYGYGSQAGTSVTAPLLSKTKMVFQFTLIHREESESPHSRRWILRSDTEEELQQWESAIRDVCPSCFNMPEPTGSA